MQLVLMLPENKPPFIGVLVNDNDHRGNTLNKDLVLHHKNKLFKIHLEYYNGVLNLMLICEALVTVRFYNKLSHDPIKLRSWLYMVKVKQTPVVNFGHVNNIHNKWSIEKVEQTNINWVLKINRLEMIKPDEEPELLYSPNLKKSKHEVIIPNGK